MELAKAALSYGMVPIILCGKRPLLPKWQQTTKANALAKVQNNKRKDCKNIGILTGSPSGVVVVDIDTAKGGLELWEDLISEYNLPHTFTVETGSGGRHYYFLYNNKVSGLRNATRAIKNAGIDLKTTGGQVVFPGSIHPETGNIYAVLDGYDPETGTIFLYEMPYWLRDLLTSNQKELDLKYRK